LFTRGNPQGNENLMMISSQEKKKKGKRSLGKRLEATPPQHPPLGSRRSSSCFTTTRTSLFGTKLPNKVQTIINKNNCLVNLENLSSGVQNQFQCRFCCSNDIELKEKELLGVSSILEIRCNNCMQHTVVEPISRSCRDENQNVSVIDFEVNVQAIISCMLIGCGPNEVGFVLSLLNLEGGPSMERSYHTYIDRLSSHIRDESNDLILDAI